MKKVFVVGIGPGRAEEMTMRCREVLAQADILVGYTKYLELVKPLFPQKETYSTAMTGEVERCRKAIELAEEGKNVAVISSGDAGVYGMAGLVLELSEGREVSVEIVPGVSAAQAGAALLGAPLGHDFAVISLSDLLTPWELIEKRLALAAEGDFCLAIYNPASRKRSDHLEKAAQILLQWKSSQTLCALTHHIGREAERHELLLLKDLAQAKADMFTTVFIGNSRTRNIDGKMVTPRGYSLG